MAKDRDSGRRGGPNTFFDDSPTAETHAVDQRLPIQGATGPVGDVGLPPARPGVAVLPAASSPVPHNVRNPRPTSTLMSPGEQTHIPNITHAAFYSPSSSRQPLEEERPLSPATEVSYRHRQSVESGKTFERGHVKRDSNASIVTLEQSQRPLVDVDAPPIPQTTPSRPVDTIYESSQTISPRVTGLGVSTTFKSTDQTGPSLLQQNKPVHNSPHLGDTNPQSSRSARSPRLEAAWSSVRNGLSTEQPSGRGHQRLPSKPPSHENMHRQASMSRPRAAQASQPDKNYAYYNGNAVFFFQGRLLNARTRPLNILTAVLAISPALFYFIFSAPYLWRHVSPAIPIFYAYFFWITISAFFHASFTDPGIFPRNLHKFPPTPDKSDPLALGPSTTRWVDIKSFKPSDAAEGETLAMQEPTKYCDSCNIWRRPRTHHCRVCDACIETHDHHCVWLNNCVGRRNYRYFLTFVTMGTVLAIYMFGTTVGMISHFANHNNMSFGDAIGHDWSLGGTFFLFLYSIFVCAFPASLMCYHFWLISRGETTREYLRSHKFRDQDRHRPFDLYNLRANLEAVLCRPRPPTYMQFKMSHLEGDQRFNVAKTNKMVANSAVEMTDLKNRKHELAGPNKTLQTLQKGWADLKASQKL